MAWINFLTTSGYASAIQSDLYPSDIAIKMVFDGALIDGMPNYSATKILTLDGGGSTPMFIEIYIDVNVLKWNGPGTGFDAGLASEAAFTAGNKYILYYHCRVSPAEERFAIYDSTGTLVDAGTLTRYNTLDIGSTNPLLTIGRLTGDTFSSSRETGIDAIAIYDDVPPDETTEPAPTDSNILAYWAFKEGTGSTIANEVAGGTNLTVSGVEDTDWTWETGGIWDGGGAPAGPEGQLVTTKYHDIA